MVTTATVKYTIDPAPTVTLAQLNIATSMVTLSVNDMNPIGVTLFSDNTAIVGGEVVRTIVFHLNALYNTLFPTNVDGPFFDLFTHELGNGLSSKVIASAPVVV